MELSSLLLIGGGNMGAALAARWQQHLPGCRLHIVEPDKTRRAALAVQGFATHARLADAPVAAYAVLAVKPQIFSALRDDLAAHLHGGTLISIMAGVPLAALQPLCTHAVRVMPNTPAMIGEGVSAIYAPTLTADRLAIVKDLFAAAGHVVVLDDEAAMHAVTAISGSGPAYLFAFMEALEAAAMALGLDATTARVLVTQTIRGSALLADREGGNAARLRTQVTSPGGTTEAALARFSEGQFSRLVAEAAAAAAARSKALAE